jgi:hypothetical protein
MAGVVRAQERMTNTRGKALQPENLWSTDHPHTHHVTSKDFGGQTSDQSRTAFLESYLVSVKCFMTVSLTISRVLEGKCICNRHPDCQKRRSAVAD